jgi:hypothetical protein
MVSLDCPNEPILGAVPWRLSAGQLPCGGSLDQADKAIGSRRAGIPAVFRQNAAVDG